jgi:hypothetical protein
MGNSLLDTAFQILSDHDHQAWTNPLHPNTAPGKGRLHELKRQFSGLDPRLVEDAYKRAEQLLEAATEFAESNRGPRNDFTGPPFDTQALADRCPGFSRATYDAALNEGFTRTR